MKARIQAAIKTIWYSILGNTVLAIIKGVAGYFGQSYALMADALETTADIFSSFLLLFGIKYSSKPADKNHPYGHGRAEPLITFLVVGFLVASAVIIAYESIKTMNTPRHAPKGYTLIVLGGIIIIKEIFYRVIKYRNKETKSSALNADAWHHRSDAITSLTAFIGISVALIMGPGYEKADNWAALIAAASILFNSYLIFRPALGEIMDEHFYDELTDQIKEIATEVEGVRDVEKALIRKAGMMYHVDMHVFVDADIPVRDGHTISHNLKDRLREKMPELSDVLIHIEPFEGKRA